MGSNAYEKTISDFSKQRVLVVGDLMVDKYIIGEVNRISPEAPVQVVDVVDQEHFPGGAGNVVRNLRALDAKVSVLSVVGDDKYGEWLIDEFDGMELEEVVLFRDSLRPTTLKERIMVNHQQILRIDREARMPIGLNYESMIVDFLKKDLDSSDKSYDAIFISDYAKGVVTERIVHWVVEEASRKSTLVIVDPKGIEWTKYTHASVLSPNEKEVATMYEVVFQEKMKDKKGLGRIGRYLIEKLRLEALLITRGEKGITLFTTAGVGASIEMLEIPTKARDVFDVIGAGDTALSVFGLAIASDSNYFEAAHLANHAAGIVVGKVGTSAVTRKELLEEVLND